MSANPFPGVLFHRLGGLAAGSLPVPHRGLAAAQRHSLWT